MVRSVATGSGCAADFLVDHEHPIILVHIDTSCSHFSSVRSGSLKLSVHSKMNHSWFVAVCVILTIT